MSWYSIPEFSDRFGVPETMVLDQAESGRLESRRIGGQWFVRVDGPAPSPAPEPSFRQASLDVARVSETQSSGGVQGVIEFSSKALHHYLLMTEKLVAEKDLRLKEREEQLAEKKQSVAELEAYVDLLEEQLRKEREKPEGWR